MLDIATVREYAGISTDRSADIVRLWNAAYPVMRQITSGYVNSMRDYVEREGWVVDPDHPRADILSQYTVPEDKARRKLRFAEELRRELGQLDRGTHKGCTRSPGGFTITAAYSRVRSVVGLSSLGTEGMGSVYRLAAALAEAEETLNAMRRNRD
jgi:hypothetical protein